MLGIAWRVGVWPEWRAHPWRQLLALLAVALGVALAWSVHLINRSALAEFSAAVRAVQGEPDASIACIAPAGCDDVLVDRLAGRADVALALPVLEISSYALGREGQRVALRLIGLDALQVAAVAPELLPRPAAGQARSAVVDPDRVFLNPAAEERLGHSGSIAVQHGAASVRLEVGGRVAVGGAPLAVLDIAGAQQHFGFAGRLTRIDLRLAPGADSAALAAALPAGWQLTRADDAQQRVSNASRAYRVNLTVLALVALFVGAFLVFAVLALSVARRVPSLALLGVLGLSAAERGAMLRLECTVLGVAGSALGLLLGSALAQAALVWLAGDLGAGYFPSVAPTLQFAAADAALFALLGTLAALVGGWLPARQAAALAPAQALKGLGGLGGTTPSARHRQRSAAAALLLLTTGATLALLPPWGGLPWAAYASVALLLLGGIAGVPALIGLLLARLPAFDAPLPLLALRRAHHEREMAAVALAGVVASLALSVALTVMVASFRQGVAHWLDQVLPADLYLRSAAQSSAADQAFLPPGLVERVAGLPGVARVEASRTRGLQLAPERPAVSLIARPLGADPAAALPLLGPALPPDARLPGVFVSEAVRNLYGAAPGSELVLRLGEQAVTVRVRGIWRDFARQFGAIVIDAADYRHLTGDERLNDLALWLGPGAQADEVRAALRAAAEQAFGGQPLFDIASASQLRRASLAIFDRSFAVTRWLQGVAIVIGLAGIAASFSAQVVARRREFGMLMHLGFTRAQVIGLVAGEGAACTAAGALAGLALGLAVSTVLVHVVNPQSFHWTMDLVVPWTTVAVLAAAVLLAGTLTAALAARAAAAHDMVAALKEDA
jgi:putative ABC transport system permease protein